jgi:predicted dehydrogenase
MEEARKRNLMVQICHPLRYTPFYSKVKELLDAGKIGKIISLSMVENVGYWHFAHSYVRGNWRNFETSGPLILTKCCHDMDIATWLVDEKVRNISSFGTLSFFKEENAPKGSPARCTDGCPVEDTCSFYAPKFYLHKANEWPVDVICVNSTHEARENALKTGPYGRCVFRCDNDVPDHQVVAVEFENDVTLDFMVVANSYNCHRTIRVIGTEGELNGFMEKNEIVVDRFQPGLGESHVSEHFTPEVVIDGHAGGDTGVIQNFLSCYKNEDYDGIFRSLEIAVEGHLLSFASEEARKNKSIVSMQDYKKNNIQKEAALG